jgi:hypothetical protein
MNPTLVQELARYRMDNLKREAEANQLAALAKGTASRPVAVRERLSRTAGRLRLVNRGSAA